MARDGIKRDASLSGPDSFTANMLITKAAWTHMSADRTTLWADTIDNSCYVCLSGAMLKDALMTITLQLEPEAEAEACRSGKGSWSRLMPSSELSSRHKPKRWSP